MGLQAYCFNCPSVRSFHLTLCIFTYSSAQVVCTTRFSIINQFLNFWLAEFFRNCLRNFMHQRCQNNSETLVKKALDNFLIKRIRLFLTVWQENAY